MIETAELSRLAEHAGVETEYRDAWGKRHGVAPESLRRLLAAMGFAVRTPAEIDRSLRKLKEADWRRVLPPVLVHHAAKAPVQIVVTIPRRLAATEIACMVEAEDGRQRAGRFRPEALPLEEERTIDGEAIERRLFLLPFEPACGYHRFRLNLEKDASPDVAMTLIVVPDRAYRPPAISGENKTWGFAVQLYSVQSRRNWGIGDFGDLKRLVAIAADAGADVLGLNPLHALFPGNPDAFSPYGPCSRYHLNPLYIDVEAVPEFAVSPEARRRVGGRRFQKNLEALRTIPLVDYRAVAKTKYGILEILYRAFRRRHLDQRDRGITRRGRAFRRFCDAGGDPLWRYAVFEALAEHLGSSGDSGKRSRYAWWTWPHAYRDSGSEAVARFADTHAVRVDYFRYLQWIADRQLRAAVIQSSRKKMAIGLFQDLAVGVDRGSAEAWALQNILAEGVAIGAPPDAWNLLGQNWGFPPMNPHRLRACAYLPFIRLIRANMSGPGALRIDHILGLMRQFWIPAGAPAAEGGYVRYPFEDLLGIVALESQRHECLVVGEDLGTVPESFRDRMAQTGILSYRLLYFEKDDTGRRFLAPERYPSDALVATGNHDLPTVHGFWSGHDLALREALGLFPDDGVKTEEMAARKRDRGALRDALRDAGLFPDGLLRENHAAGAMPQELVEALYAFLAGTPARLLMVHLEDILGVVEQHNLPGTTTEHPNWRRKLPVALELLARDSRIAGLVKRLSASRYGRCGDRRNRG